MNMNNNVYELLLNNISLNNELFNEIVNLDNTLGLNATYDDIIDYLEYSFVDNELPSEINSKIIITEGDILTILKILHDLVYYKGEFIIYINSDNMLTINYLVNVANNIYEKNLLDVRIRIDNSNNYNKYLDSNVIIIGSSNFVNTAYQDFNNYNLIICQ